LVPPAAAPTKRGRKAGLTEDDFRPADDILERLQQAWEQAQAGTVAGDAQVVVPPPLTTDPEPIGDPVLNDAMRRVLERLERTRAGKEAGTMDQSPESSDQPPEQPAPEAAPSAGTVTEGVVQLEADGYGDDLRFEGGLVVCRRCGTSHATEAAEVERVLRFEGPSDPADEAIVLGLRCPECGAKGSLVSAFGPDADPELAQAFVYLASKARHR
jgi:hypothetical protein